MNKKISFPIAIIIIVILAVLVGGVAVWQYFNMPEIEPLEVIPPKKTIPKIEVSPHFTVKTEPRIDVEVSDATSPEKYELRVYDSQGKVTGLVNGEVKRNVQDSFYFSGYTQEVEENIINVIPQQVTIFDPKDLYVYEIFGLIEGNYKFNTSYVEEGKKVTFLAYNIPLLPGETHQYHFDWEAFTQGKDGVALLIDSNKDGAFEKTINPDLVLSEVSEEEFIVLTREEFISKLGVSP